MVDEENKDNKNLLDELNSIFADKNTKDSGFSNYTQSEQMQGFMPTNPYDHAYGLLAGQGHAKKIEKDGIDVINDPQIMLGTIDDPKTLRRYQLDLYYLTNMAGLAINDPMFKSIFEVLWTNFRNEVRITSAMDGAERQYQAFHIPSPRVKRGFRLGIKRKKPREPIDYVLPQEEDEGGMF